MRFIPGPTQLEYAPRACAVTNRSDGDFVDLQVSIDDPFPTRLYLKREIVEDAGKLCGMVPAKEVEALREQLAEMETRYAALGRLEEAAAEYAEAVEAVAA